MVHIGLRCVALLTAASLTMAVSSASVAQAQTPPVSVDGSFQSISNVSVKSDHDVAQLLLTGSGPLADRHPAVVHALGFDRLPARASDEKIRTFVDGFLTATPQFRTDVANKLQTGDPFQAESALRNITGELQTYLQKTGTLAEAGRAGADMSPNGFWRVKVKGGAVVNVVALVNGGLYANVAVATEVAVAAAVVWLAGIFLTYKFDATSTNGFDHDSVVENLTRDLKRA